MAMELESAKRVFEIVGQISQKMECDCWGIFIFEQKVNFLCNYVRFLG